MVPSFDGSKFEQMKASGDLPSPKGAALAIIRMTQQPDLALSELARAIKTDPAFVGRLIKAANGLLSLDRRPVTSVPEALMVLGLPAVRTMALGFSLLSNYRSGGCAGFDYDRYWCSSLLTALAMQLVTQRTRAAAPDEAFSVGLLARIGELALATMYATGYGAVLAESRQFPESRLVDLERRSFAMDHRELSAAMLADWRFPNIFCQPIFYFEQSERAPYGEGSREYTVTHSLVLAAAMAELCLAEEVEQASLLPKVMALAAPVGLDGEVLIALSERLAKEWPEWGAMLGLKTRPLPSFAQLAEAVTVAEVACPDPERSAPPAETVSKESAGKDVAAGGSGLRVLVVDDNGSIRAVLRGVLESAGHRVFEAANGRAALELALEVQPQLMIVDWVMPEMDGLELTRSLRKTKIGRTIYILLLTNLEEDDRLIEAFENGVDDFVTKPVKPRVLAARLRAGHRVIRLQQEIERDREEIRHFAAELAVSNRRLQEVALTDSLTGFPNRRYAIERMAKEWSASQRSRRPLSCMVIDVDGFKQINDGFGHDVGDAVLVQVSAALKQALRSQDVIARTGGDEFVVICPETPLEAAAVCGERLRKAVELARMPADGKPLGVTISVGVATRDGTMADPDVLLKRADQGAYLAKQRGRNKVGTVQAIPKAAGTPGSAGGV